MVRHDHGQPAIAQHPPEPFAVEGGAERRGALCDPAEALYVVLDIKKVMRASLAADVDATVLSLVDQLRPSGCADVHDVEPAPDVACDLDGLRDRFQLGIRRPRPDEVASAWSIGRVEARRVFRVDQQDGTELRDFLHPSSQDVRVTGREFVDAAGAHEGFEAGNATFHELANAIDAAWHQPGPQPEIDD